jgi:hypothetical protein
MANLFKKFIGKLNEAQQKLLIQNKDVQTPVDINTYTYDGANKPITIFKEVYENSQMSVAGYNDMIGSLLIDIEAMYINTELMSELIGNNESISKQWVSVINTEIDKLETKINEYRKLYGDDKGYNAIYYEAFNENKHSLLNNCIINSGALKIRPFTTVEYTKPIDIDNVTLTTYPSENHAAGIFLSSPSEFDIVKDYEDGTKTMIKKGTSFPGAWVSVLLTDTDVKSYISDGDGNTIEYSGYNCLLRIFFNSPKNINSLAISPSTRYKLGISRLRYRKGGIYASDDIGWENVTKTHYSNDIYNGNILNVISSGYSTIDMMFDPITASSIEILFTMPSYDVIRYNIDKSIIRSAMMWDDITDKEYDDIVSKYSNMDVIGSPPPYIASTSYLDRTIIDITNLNDFNSMIKAVNSSLNINQDTELQQTGIPNIYLLNDRADEVALKGQLTTVNKNEYIIGAYSIVSEYNNYNSNGSYISHDQYGFDSYEGTVINVAIESDFEIPRLSSVEFFIVTDTNVEIPILPVGITTHREPMDSEIDDDGNAEFTTSMTPDGNVKVYKWENNSKVLVGEFPPNGDNKITASDLNKMTMYAVEYVTNVNSITLSESITKPIWEDINITPIGNKVQLPTYPFVDYNYYDWDAKEWSRYEKVAGYYSDNTVLLQDIESPMWILPTGFTSGEFIHELTDRDNFAISGSFLTSGDFYFTFNGKDRIDNQIGAESYEYSYMWDVPVSGYVSGDFPLASSILLNDTLLDLDEDEYSSTYNINRYEPVEVFINGVKATDMTNYKSNDQDILSQLTAQNYEYFLHNNILYLNGNLNDKRVSVRYKYLSKYIRVKIILSTNESIVSETTPIVNDYTLKMLGI